MAVPMAALLLAFGADLVGLFQFSRKSNLFSYIPLVPAITIYLIWRDRKYFSPRIGTNLLIPGIFGLAGITALVLGRLAVSRGWPPAPVDWLSVTIFSFVCLFNACCFLAGGTANIRKLIFPLIFLFLMIPLPTFLTNFLTMVLQYSSAEVSYWFLKLSGMPVLRNGLVFQLPKIDPLLVAPECSGIHSTLVLLITSMLAGHLFLRRPWRKWTLALAVIPLGIVRNGFRIFVIGWMSSNVDPGFIHGPLHRRGGPVFFVLSLVPLFALLFYFRRLERRETLPQKDPSEQTQHGIVVEKRELCKKS